MPVTGLTSLGPIFGLTLEQSDYVLELAYHASHGAWARQDDPMMPWMKALVRGGDSFPKVQTFAVMHTLLAKACDDPEAPILTGQPATVAQAAFSALRFDAHSGPLQAIDHVQISIPIGGEDMARPFYTSILGLTEVPKPPVMAARGGAWYVAGAVKVHLGVEADFRANDKAHPAFVVLDVEGLAQRAEAAGYRVKHDTELPGYIRAFLYDPFGNRIEILKPKQTSGHAPS
jgi:catechol 2,3-dioxygenase-like lactoylglutathione lyase family enzyme